MPASPEEEISKLSFEFFQTFEKHKIRLLKTTFKDQIRGSFLIEMHDRVGFALGPDFGGVFDIIPDAKQMLMASGESIQYEICCHIVGTHRANTVFMSMEQIRALQRDEEYKEKLTKQVLAHLKTRRYGSAHFRKQPMVQGECFAYFSVPYEMFVLSMRANEIISKEKDKFDNPYKHSLYGAILGKSFATLSLLGDNFLDSAYPTCRTVIELFAKLMILNDSTELYEEAARFAQFDLTKNCCTGKYPEEFKKAFETRKNQHCKNMIDYLHFGFLDRIENYHDIVKQNPYSITGIWHFLASMVRPEDASTITLLESLYRQCNGYAHGGVSRSMYPLLHYFEISVSLAIIIPIVFQMICSESGETPRVNGVDIIEECNRDIPLLADQYQRRSTDNFKDYYMQFGHY